LTPDSSNDEEKDRMRKAICVALLAGAFAMGAPIDAGAQDSGLLAVGEMAPDFALPGATRYGVLEEPVRLSDYRGETVVLAFFFRVRTRG
jgi:peroxiredoxin Q/BCP